jgi:non-heme chloroperoxidase
MKREIMRLPPVVANSILFDQTTRDYRDMLSRIDVPTLLCFGADEKLVPVAAGEHLRSAIQKSELVVFEQSSHCPFIEEASSFNDLIALFLSNQRPGRLEALQTANP